MISGQKPKKGENLSIKPEAQLALMKRAWVPPEDVEGGYVFLPWIDGKAKTRPERIKSYHEGKAFKWPEDEKEILQHIKAHTEDEQYWCPGVFAYPRRISDNLMTEHSLWADLDAVHPDNIDTDLRPTIAWESSPGRYQALWLLRFHYEGASWPGEINHRLTHHLGADPSGWDSTQLLRVPGSTNHKPEYIKKYREAPQGKILWRDGPIYRNPKVFRDLPEIEDVRLVDDVIEAIFDDIDTAQVLARIRLKLPKRIKELINVTEEDALGRSDHSGVLWDISRALADVGCNLAEVVAITRNTAWNKYRGRQDELIRLKIGAAKAIAAVPIDLKKKQEELKERPDSLQTMGTLLQHVKRPDWLVDDVWTVGACGFISGAPKSYKSWTALDLATSVATGLPFLGVDRFRVKRPGPVIYIQAEDTAATVKSRWEQIIDGKDPAYHPQGHLTRDKKGQVWWHPPKMEIPMFGAIQIGFTASDPEWQEWLGERIRDVQAKMVVIDTLMTVAGDVDTDRAHEMMAKMLHPLKDLAHEHNCALVIVHHNKKDTENGGRWGRGNFKNKRGGARMLGSVAIHAWAEDALYLTSDENKTWPRKVWVERESKSTNEAFWSMEVPRMEQGEGWAPLVDMETPSEAPGSDSKAPRGGGRGGKVYKTLQRLGPGVYRTSLLAEEAGVTRQGARAQCLKLQEIELLSWEEASKGWRFTTDVDDK